MSTKFEKCPEFVDSTPQGIAEARRQLAQLRQNPSYDLTMNVRRSALAARLNSGMKLTALQYVEFESALPTGYRSTVAVDASSSEAWRRQSEQQARAKAAQEQREYIASPHRRMTMQEAQVILGPQAYMQWCQANQDLVHQGMNEGRLG